MLHDARRPHLGGVGVLPGVPSGAPLAEQVPELVKLNLERLEPGAVLFVDQSVDAGYQLGVVHGRAVLSAPGG